MQIPSRLLFYVPSLAAGGAERIWAQLATAFYRRGHPVTMVVDVVSEASRPFLDPAIPLLVLDAGHRRAIVHLARLLDAQRPDVALAAVAGSNLKLALALRCARPETRAKTRLVISYHGFEEWRSGNLSLATYLALPWLSRTAARTVAVSDGLRDALVGRWRASPGRTVRIYNPVWLPDALTVATGAAELAARPPLVLAVGRLVADKCFPLLIRAFAGLVRSDARLVILGEGPERTGLEAMVATLGLGGRVELPGFAEPWPWYARARCFALASRTESFANVVVEALAHGLPVVATRCGGPAEILAGGDLGELVPVGDVAVMTAALERALAAPGDPAPRIERARTFAFATGFASYAQLVDDVAASD